jgi:hypothetical protein
MQEPFRERGTRATVFTAAVNSLSTLGALSIVIAPILCMNWSGPAAEEPAATEPPGSGIILRTEVTTIWVPRALVDRARHQSGFTADRVPLELHRYLIENGWSSAWYALTYRAHLVNGGSAEITQIRRLSDVGDHFDEFQAVMATAAARPSRSERADFSHAAVEVIPEALRAVEPREAINRLLAEPVVGDQSSPSGDLDSTRRTE